MALPIGGCLPGKGIHALGGLRVVATRERIKRGSLSDASVRQRISIAGSRGGRHCAREPLTVGFNGIDLAAGVISGVARLP